MVLLGFYLLWLEMAASTSKDFFHFWVGTTAVAVVAAAVDVVVAVIVARSTAYSDFDPFFEELP